MGTSRTSRLIDYSFDFGFIKAWLIDSALSLIKVVGIVLNY